MAIVPLCLRRRYISIYRHLQRNPDNQLYPLFEYFENWCQVGCRDGGGGNGAMSRDGDLSQDCQVVNVALPSAQDENRHGDFLAACLKARPELLNTFEAKLWSK